MCAYVYCAYVCVLCVFVCTVGVFHSCVQLWCRTSCSTCVYALSVLVSVLSRNGGVSSTLSQSRSQHLRSAAPTLHRAHSTDTWVVGRKNSEKPHVAVRHVHT